MNRSPCVSFNSHRITERWRFFNLEILRVLFFFIVGRLPALASTVDHHLQCRCPELSASEISKGSFLINFKPGDKDICTIDCPVFPESEYGRKALFGELGLP
jgi:hypothetical protein